MKKTRLSQGWMRLIGEKVAVRLKDWVASMVE
jgi:hypothetical protein